MEAWLELYVLFIGDSNTAAHCIIHNSRAV